MKKKSLYLPGKNNTIQGTNIAKYVKLHNPDKMRIIKIVILPCLLLLFHNNMIAQDNDDHIKIPLSLSTYLTNVTKGNLEFIANQFNVSIAEAELKASRVFADPEISVEYSNNEDWTLQMGQSVSAGISYPISTGNKRGASIEVAKTRLNLEQAVLEAWLQNLKADASLNYYASLKDLYLFQLQEDTYSRLLLLARADSVRFISGDITELDAIRSRLEARSQHFELERSRAVLTNSLLNLSRLQGKVPGDTLFIPSDEFPMVTPRLIVSELIDRALKFRAELHVAAKTNELSDKQLRLLKAQRAPEFSLEAGYSHNSIVLNEIAPAPVHNSYSAGIVVPFKFSNMNKGEIRAAEFAARQSETIRRDVENLIITEVIQAFNIYKAMEKQIGSYSLDLIESAEKILEGRTYLYKRGETNLIDVLEAQRTFNETKMQYYQIMYDYAAALTELKRAQAIE